MSEVVANPTMLGSVLLMVLIMVFAMVVGISTPAERWEPNSPASRQTICARVVCRATARTLEK